MYRLKKSYISVLKRFLPGLWLFSIAWLMTGVISAQQLKSVSQLAAEQYLHERGEVILRFAKPAGFSMDYLTRILSIDRFRNNTITAYANDIGFRKFLSLQIPFDVLYPPSLKTDNFQPRTLKSGDWRDHYPSYNEYVSLMEGFEAEYPDLCKLTNFGTSVRGHKLLALKISDNPGIHEHEPVVFYTSSMHGDETLGYILMLRLIDYILSNYETSPEVKFLADHIEIWINPLANPDGSYFLSDTSVAGATRFNANQVDLNRDFPDLRDFTLKEVPREPETIAMMDFMNDIMLVLAANFHGGAEVVNYPWDTWFLLHADDAWYRHISRAYADTAHLYAPAGYMTFLDNGITNGNEWYTVYGGRQDYVNFFLYAREVTIELSDENMPSESSLESYWSYNRNSMLQYIGQALTGISGIITDSVTGEPVMARIRIEGHDFDHSWVYSSSEDGSYYRLIGAGDYSLRISSPDYLVKRQYVNVTDGALTQFDVNLTPVIKALYPNPFLDELNFYLSVPGDDLQVEFFDLSGRKVKHIIHPVEYRGPQTIRVSDLAAGVYVVRIRYKDEAWKQVVIKQGFSRNE